MNYTIVANSNHIDEGTAEIGENEISFGISKQNNLPTPADLLITAFAACCLKNIERFSEFMKYNYKSATITVEASRKDKPPMIEKIKFSIQIQSDDDHINTELLLRNLQKFGTIYNTLKIACAIEGDIVVLKN